MKTNQSSFADTLRLFEYTTDLRTAFEDFLTMAICSFGQKPGAGISYDEPLYLETITKYKDEKLRSLFPKLLALLTLEITERMESSEG